MTVKLVSGFVPIVGHERPPAEYRELGQQLLDMGHPIAMVQASIQECWMYQYFAWKGEPVTHSEGDNPKKNSRAYHIVQHQKTEWMVAAALQDPAPDVFVWVDFGIFHVPGITATVILNFLQRAETEQAIAIPGCWPRAEQLIPIPDTHPCWRFCGGAIVCPRRHLMDLDTAVKHSAMQHISRTGNVSWEVNTWARMEQDDTLPVWWYQADHNASMFTNYKGSHNA